VRFLLDTHTLLWWLAGDQRMSGAVRAAIIDEANTVVVSAASIWEIATKSRIGKLPGIAAIAHRIPEVLADERFEAVGISPREAHRAGWLAGHHRDPFDRMLVAQALELGLPIATRDAALKQLGATTFW